MKANEAIKYLQQLYPNGGHCWLDEQRIEAIGMAINALQEEPVSKDLEEALEEFIDSIMGHIEFNSATPFAAEYVIKLLEEAFKAGAQWQKEHSFSDPQINENIIYAKGYKQAEKDLELTWEDIRLIDIIAAKFAAEHGEWAYKKRHYEEILEQFLEQKGGKV